jgi:hypothetical protein
MVLVSHLYNFIYIKNYKTASSSVEAFFGQYCIDPLTISSYSFDDSREEEISEYGILGSRSGIKQMIHPIRNTKWVNHMNSTDIKKEIGETIFNNYFKFCVIRNPYDIMVSSYHWDIFLKNITSDTTFSSYCKLYTFLFEKKERVLYNRNNMSRILLDNQPICDYYIRYEYLKEDIRKVLDKLGITDYDLNKLPNHKSGIRPKDTHYRKYYDDETREIVYQLHKNEIKQFDYEF